MSKLTNAAIRYYRTEMLSIMEEEEYWEAHMPGQWEMVFKNKRYRCRPTVRNEEGRVRIRIEELKSIDVAEIWLDEDGNITKIGNNDDCQEN